MRRNSKCGFLTNTLQYIMNKYVLSYEINILVTHVSLHSSPWVRSATVYSEHLISLILNTLHIGHMIVFCIIETSSRTVRALSGHSCQPKLLKLVCCLHTRAEGPKFTKFVYSLLGSDSCQ